MFPRAAERALGTCCYGASRGIDVQVDWLLGVVCFEEEELCDDGGGHGLVDLAIEADDALLYDFVSWFGEDGVPCRSYFQEPGKDVICFSRRSRLVRFVQSVERSVATYRCASHRPNNSVSKLRNNTLITWDIPLFLLQKVLVSIRAAVVGLTKALRLRRIARRRSVETLRLGIGRPTGLVAGVMSLGAFYYLRNVTTV